MRAEIGDGFDAGPARLARAVVENQFDEIEILFQAEGWSGL